MDYITLLSILIGFIALAIYLKSPNKSNEENQEKIILDKLNNDIKDLSHQNGQNRQEINDLQKINSLFRRFLAFSALFLLIEMLILKYFKI